VSGALGVAVRVQLGYRGLVQMNPSPLWRAVNNLQLVVALAYAILGLISLIANKTGDPTQILVSVVWMNVVLNAIRLDSRESARR
jgi:hypothetical protein